MKRTIKAFKDIIITLREIFDDWLTKSAGLVFLMIIAIVIYNMSSDLSDRYPLLGALVYAMVPVLFIVGGVIFVMAILKFSKPENIENKS